MKVLLVTWYDAAWHPVMIFTSQVLSERGHQVSIFYRQPDPGRAIPGQVDYGTGTYLYPVGGGQIGWRNQLAYVDFIRRVALVSHKLRPDVIVGYDMHGLAAAYFAQRLCPKARLAYHNFDLASRELLSLFGKLVKSLEGRAARAADLVIASSPGRAQALWNEHQLGCAPLVLLNCQRQKAYAGPRGELANILQQRNLPFERLVIRLGSLGPHHGIEATVRSVPNWQGNWGLVLAGIGSEAYLQFLDSLIADLGLEQRVILLSPVSYDLWYDCLYSADLGIALYEKGNINHDSMAGAGNKLNLHLKAGIPSIVPDIPDFVSFVKEYGVGLVADPKSAESIAVAVNAILGNDMLLANMRHKAQQAFQEIFNFEKQFEPVLAWLSDDVSRSEFLSSSHPA